MTVYLVGAGPGDPGLITVKGASVLAAASFVVYDRLTAAQLLALAGEHAELICVGKDPNATSVPQDEINELLVRLGSSGQTVVRLKGGDPFIFARGAEEIDALIEAGVDYEVVPGVTSAIAAPAYAGIPVTERFTSTSLTLITGHEDPTKGDDPIDWAAAAAVGGTIVVLMGAKNWDTIRAGLIDGGRDPSTPVAAVRWGTTDRQETVFSTLVELSSADLKPPVTIVVGPVARADRPSVVHPWFVANEESRSVLEDKRIVLTRSMVASRSLAESLRAERARVSVIPATEISHPDAAAAALDSALSSIDSYDWLVLTSANGARSLLAAVDDLRMFAGISIAAVGAATADVLRQAKLGVDLVAPQANAESLATALAAASKGPQRALFVTSVQGRRTIQDRLGEQGWAVDRCEAYSTDARSLTDTEIAALNAADAVVFAAPSAVASLSPFVPAGCRLVAIGDVTATALRDALDSGRSGGTVVVAESADDKGLLEALHRAFSS